LHSIERRHFEQTISKYDVEQNIRFVYEVVIPSYYLKIFFRTISRLFFVKQISVEHEIHFCSQYCWSFCSSQAAV